MSLQKIFRTIRFAPIWTAALLAACAPALIPQPTMVPATPSAAPEWYGIPLTDVRTNQQFSIAEFSGRPVLIETIAQWCPNCLMQQAEIRRLHELLPQPYDLVSISLDVDMNEDAASLRQYAEEYGFEWRFAVSPLLVSRALGNLYSAQYLNPPLRPMLLIDREGVAHQLPYGHKKAEELLTFIQPYL